MHVCYAYYDTSLIQMKGTKNLKENNVHSCRRGKCEDNPLLPPSGTAEKLDQRCVQPGRLLLGLGYYKPHNVKLHYTKKVNILDTDQ